MKVKCEVVEDLLPLYIDGVCSNESKVIVEEHLQECSSCREKFKAQNKEILIDENIIRENLKSKEPFKKIRKKEILNLMLFFLIVAVITSTAAFLRSNVVWRSNDTKMIEKVFHKPMKAVYSIDYLYMGKKYKIILATAEDTKDELYLQCFEERMGGLFYEYTVGAAPGEYNYMCGITGINNKIFIVFGYNKDFMANSYSVKNLKNNEWITHDISKEEYFLQIYTDIDYPKLIFKDNQGNDITIRFMGRLEKK